MTDYKKYDITPEEFERLGEYAGVDVTVTAVNEIPAEENPHFNYDKLVDDLAGAAFFGEPEDFCEFAGKWQSELNDGLLFHPEIKDIILLGYKRGISQGFGPSATCLGGLYYMGVILEQDYQKAAELYEIAMELEEYQSVINLGYIYEYGRTGEKDYQKAYQYYSLAAALTNNMEAIYKMGDIYSRGTVFGKDMPKAISLWRRSYNIANENGDMVGKGQPALRLAQVLINPECEEWGMRIEPLLALKLFQEAEYGLRVEISNGATYYEKRLQEAIDGQAQARAMLDITLNID